MAALKYWLWLTSRTGLGTQLGWDVLEKFGSPERAYYASNEEYDQLIVPSYVRESLKRKGMEESDRILGDCERLGISIVTYQDAEYPERLRNIYSPPLVLYCKGKKIAFDEEIAIGMVGTRSCTPYGIRAAGQLSMDLARNGAIVVSGIAEGIDAACIRGALKGGGTVVSVLGGGIDKKYPASSAALYDDVAAVGALISEYPPGTETKGQHFPVRNRLISGLSLGVVAVESGLKGGALITIEHALDQDRDVFAVPGPIDVPSSAGTNRLIRLGAAKLVSNAWDILEEYTARYPGKLANKGSLSRQENIQRLESVVDAAVPLESLGKGDLAGDDMICEAAEKRPVLKPSQVDGGLSADQQAVLLALDVYARSKDDLVERTQMPARQVMSAITMLQIRGFVVETQEGRYEAKFRLVAE